MSSTTFDQYERELQRAIENARQKLRSSQNPSQRIQSLSQADALADDCQGLLRRLEKESQVSSPQLRLPQRLRSCQAEVKRLEREIQSEKLLGGNSGTNNINGGFSDDPRQGLLSNQNRLDETSDRLMNAHRIAADSEALGGNILTDMYGQREQLQNVRGQVEHVEDGITRSRKILASMGRRVVTNNLILAFIIVVLFAAILAVAYFRWIRHLVSGDSSGETPPPASTTSTSSPAGTKAAMAMGDVAGGDGDMFEGAWWRS